MSILAVALALVLSVAAVPFELKAADAEVEIAATHAVVVDASNGVVLFDKNMNSQVAPASLTKIFTTIVALESAAIDTRMTVNGYDLVGEASIGLHSGEDVSLETLLYGMMLTSGNDAAMTVARSLGDLPGDSPQQSVNRFMERVNNTAERLGLQQTNLKNPHGLDQDGHLSTVSDIAAMTVYALNNPFFRQIISTPYYRQDGRELYNVNRFLDGYPGLIGGKTAITTKAGYGLMQAAQRDGETIVVVLLGSTAEHWYRDAQILLDLGFEVLDRGSDDAPYGRIGYAGRTIQVPEVDGPTGVGGTLTVDRLSDHEAVVRPANPAIRAEALSWRWPVVSVSLVALALILSLNYPAVIGLGALAFHHGSQLRFRPRGNSGAWSPARLFASAGLSRHGFNSILGLRRRSGRSSQNSRDSRRNVWIPQRESEESMVSSAPRAADLDSPARSRGEKAIRLALQSRYHAAADEFHRALQTDPNIDLTTCPGFWRMQPMGYISAAKGYMLNDQREDARRLLTIVQLSFKSSHELSGLFGRAIRALDD